LLVRWRAGRLLGNRRRSFWWRQGRLLNDRRSRGKGAGWLGRRRRDVLRWGRRRLAGGFFGWFRLVRRRRRGFRGGGFRLNVDDHFSRRLERLRRQGDDRERGDVERDHEDDDDRA
jgi:hypothetical protein